MVRSSLRSSCSLSTDGHRTWRIANTKTDSFVLEFKHFTRHYLESAWLNFVNRSYLFRTPFDTFLAAQSNCYLHEECTMHPESYAVANAIPHNGLTCCGQSTTLDSENQ
ncbi:hypothetical protein Zmor_012136 [Zophobas morio]|uniref:Uncharacterized protein n=1 Tax=Zophobas morio TaxID=2755281 RepID=A0AA38LZV7_9CUCU|nr:hypothetical protein Zmor_012136 [Zophobas morio]